MTVFRYLRTCFVLEPAGGVMTPALFHNTSKRVSFSRKVWAAFLTVVKSPKSRNRNSSLPLEDGTAFLASTMDCRPFFWSRPAMYIVAFFEYNILTSSNPTPEYPPVTMKTLLNWSGHCFSVKTGGGGLIWLHIWPISEGIAGGLECLSRFSKMDSSKRNVDMNQCQIWCWMNEGKRNSTNSLKWSKMQVLTITENNRAESWNLPPLYPFLSSTAAASAHVAIPSLRSTTYCAAAHTAGLCCWFAYISKMFSLRKHEVEMPLVRSHLWGWGNRRERAAIKVALHLDAKTQG